MELSEKLMDIARKNDDVMERVEIVRSFLDLTEAYVHVGKDRGSALSLALLAENGLDTVLDNLRRVLSVLETNSADLVELSEVLEGAE
ncbi:hypothetical protein QL848_000781 [Enterococcus faecium]|nr:hypothetical protein [Enterococcus faecium]